MAVRRAFTALCFVLCLAQQISKYSSNEGMKSRCKYSSKLYFKIKASLSNIEPDGDGLKWCISRDYTYRRHIGPAVKYACTIQFEKNDCGALQSSLLLLAGDVDINPGPARSPCQVCNRSVRRNEKGVNCKLCREWFHTQCIALTDVEYEGLATYELLEWSCDRCRQTMTNLEYSSDDEDMYEELKTTLKGSSFKLPWREV